MRTPEGQIAVLIRQHFLGAGVLSREFPVVLLDPAVCFVLLGGLLQALWDQVQRRLQRLPARRSSWVARLFCTSRRCSIRILDSCFLLM